MCVEMINPIGLSYPIYISSDSTKYFCEQLERSISKDSLKFKTLIITDSEVYKHYGDCLDRMCEKKQVYRYILPAGEGSKSIEQASKVWHYLASQGFHRNDQLIAFGGGMVGDFTGFVASTYMRGIRWIQVPTTLLAQIDSSVGGKVAINLEEGKNLVGSFYNPESVWICTDFLSTLPETVYRDGLGEMFKYGYLADPSILSVLDDSIKPISDIESLKLRVILQTEIQDLIKKCIHIKIAIVLKDFTESGERKFLNLGHTIGHAIESHAAYGISHGHAVMLGIWWIIELGHRLSPQSAKLYTQLKMDHENRMKSYGFDTLESLNIEKIMAFMRMDKKASTNQVTLVLLNEQAYGHEQAYDHEQAYGHEQVILDQLGLLVRLESWSLDTIEATLLEINNALK